MDPYSTSTIVGLRRAHPVAEADHCRPALGCRNVPGAAEAHDRFPGSRLEIFDNAGHFPHAAQPLRFSRLLRDFVDTTAPAAGNHQAMRRRILGSRGP